MILLPLYRHLSLPLLGLSLNFLLLNKHLVFESLSFLHKSCLLLMPLDGNLHLLLEHLGLRGVVLVHQGQLLQGLNRLWTLLDDQLSVRAVRINPCKFLTNLVDDLLSSRELLLYHLLFGIGTGNGSFPDFIDYIDDIRGRPRPQIFCRRLRTNIFWQLSGSEPLWIRNCNNR